MTNDKSFGFITDFAKGFMSECYSAFMADNPGFSDYEVIRIKKTKNECSLCEDFANEKIQKKVPIAVVSCEGACLRGEIARQAANKLCFELLPEKTSRICLGGAFTKNSGQRKLVRESQKVLVLEGCSIKCGSRMLNGVVDDFSPEIIIVDKLYDFDKNIFGINEVTEQQIKDFTQEASEKIVEQIITKATVR